MTRGMLYKLIFIISLIVFSVILILPTVGEKRMKISLHDSATEEQISFIKKRFSKSYTIKHDKNVIIVIGSNITDAIMNEVRTFKGIKNAVILKHWAEDYVLAKKINLGLDLQGGMHLVLRADFEKILAQTKEEKKLLIKRLGLLAKKKSKNKQQIKDIKDALKDIKENRLTDDGALSEQYKTEVSKQALESLRNRIDKFGVSEPSIRPRGYEAIEIQLPGVKNPQQVKDVIGKTGRVEYRFANETWTKKAMQYYTSKYKTQPFPMDKVKQDELLSEITKEAKLPLTVEALYLFDRKKNSKKLYPKSMMVLDKKVELAGSDIKKAYRSQNEYGQLAVGLETTPEGAAKFAKVTSKKNRGKRLAIVIDNKIRSAPSINEQIATGKAQITGNFTIREVQTLTRIIQEGALPIDLKIIEERTVGPSLGQDAIESGIRAIIIGLAGVMLFMIIYYKLAGIVADFGLVLNMVFMLALLSWLGFTLTLPGIAGFILTVGMAVDANVIIYERIKEEIAAGKSVRMSIVYGFDKAFWTIFDANLTTFIAAFILSQYGTGPIKGFAIILLIGILCSMFVALYVTRFIYEIISLNKKMKKLYI